MSKFITHYHNYLFNYTKLTNVIQGNFIETAVKKLQYQVNRNLIKITQLDNYDSINNFPYFEFSFYKNQIGIFKDSLDPKSQAHGINTFAIQQLHKDPTILIPKIGNQYIGILNTLKFNYKFIDSNFYNIKLLQFFNNNYIIPDFDGKYFKYVDFKWYSDDSLLDTFSPTPLVDCPVIELVIREKFLQAVFKKIFVNYEKTLRQQFNKSFSPPSSNIFASLRDTKFSHTLTTFICNHILFLNVPEISPFFRKIKQFINSLIGQDGSFTQLFTEYLNRNFSNYNKLIIYDFSKELTENIHNFYLKTQLTDNSNLGIFGDTQIPVNEILIYNYIINTINNNGIEILKQLEIIAYQFNKDPTFFVNCRKYIYNELLDNFISDLNFSSDLYLSTVGDLEDYGGLTALQIENIIKRLVINEDSLFSILTESDNNGKLDSTNLNLGVDNILKTVCYRHFIFWITSFLDSKEFNDYYLNVFFKGIYEISNDNNRLFTSTLLENINLIIRYFKLILIRNSLDDIDNSLFRPILQNFRDTVKFKFVKTEDNYDIILVSKDRQLDNGEIIYTGTETETPTGIVLTKDILHTDITESEFRLFSPFDIDIYYSRLYNFYISSVISDVIDTMLAKYLI